MSALIFTIGQSLVLRIMVDYQISESLKKPTDTNSICGDETLNCILYRAIGVYRIDIIESQPNAGAIKNLDFLGLNKWYTKFYYCLPIKFRIFANLLILVPSAGFSFFLVKRYKAFILNNFLFSMILDIIILADLVKVDSHLKQD